MLIIKIGPPTSGLLSMPGDFALRDKRNYQREFYKLRYTLLRIKETRIQKLAKRFNHLDLFKKN